MTTTKRTEKAKEPFDPLPNGKKRRLNAYQIDLKSLDREELMLWRDVFERDVPEVDGRGARGRTRAASRAC